MNPSVSIGLLIIAIIATVIFYLIKDKRSQEQFLLLQDDKPKYILNHDPVNHSDLKKVFDGLGIGKHWNYFKPHVRHEIKIKTESIDENKLIIGQSKIGGRPDMPNNVEWLKESGGKSLSFIAQINFTEVKPYDQEGILPGKGILYFFYNSEQESWGFDPKDKDKFRVYYFEGDFKNLSRLDYPSDLSDYSKYKACKLKFSSSVSLPSWENDFVREALNDKEQDLYMEVSGQEGLVNKLLGHSNNIQGIMEDECQLVTNGLYCGDPSGYNDPRAKELLKTSNEWRLLFQVDSEEENAGMMWGDVGRLYFWIKEQDLKDKKFENTWCILQCY